MGARVRVLGRVQLDDQAADRALGRGQARELLALLVTQRRAPISTPAVVDALWSREPPATVNTIVHGLVRRLRQALGADAVPHDDAGYWLDLATEDVDLWAVDDAVDRGDLATARAHWREPALGSYSTRPWALEAVAGLVDVMHPTPAEPGLLRVRQKVPVSRLVGRRRELTAVAAACRRTRLVSIVGLGGVGKTRLALEAVRQLDFDSVVHVDVGAATGPASSRVAIELGQATSGHPDADLRATASLIGRHRQLLLLDGCEHDLAGSAHVIEYLLGSCPELSVIATSRLALGVPGEHVIPLLPFADAGDPRGDAVELLLDRAQGMGVAITPQDREQAAEICRRCAGVPLAIELGVSELVFGLAGADQSRSDSASPSGPEAAVRDVVDQALRQLSEPAAAVARRAAVLVAGFSPDLVVALSDDRAPVSGVLHELVASGLVAAETSGTSRRLRFLDRVREALLAQATGTDRAAALTAVDNAFVAVRPTLDGPPMVPQLVRTLGELANAEALLADLNVAGDVAGALGLLVDMADTLSEDGQWARGSAMIEAALDAAPDADPELQARAVRALGAVSGTYEKARALSVRLETALVTSREMGAQPLEAHLLLHLANAYGYDGQLAEAFACVRQLAELAERTGSEYMQSGAASLGAMGRLLTGDPLGAQPILVNEAARLERLEALSDAARIRRSASLAFRATGDIDTALAQLQQAEHLALESRARGTLATIRTDLADLQTQLGVAGASDTLASALAAVLAVGNVRAAGLIRTRLGSVHKDPATTALGVLDLWHSDRKWAAASLATLLGQLPATHPLQASGPAAIRGLVTEWGTPLDAAQAELVAPYATVTRRSERHAATWPEEVEGHLTVLATSSQ